MKKIISMAMAFVMIVMLWGCAPKKTTEVAPIAPSTKTETTQNSIDYDMINACDALIRETYGDRAMTSIENGQFIVTILEPNLTSAIIYGTSGLAEAYDELSIACCEAMGLDTLVGVGDKTGEIIYASFNGVDITAYAN